MAGKSYQRHMRQHIRVCSGARRWADRAAHFAKIGDGKRAQHATKRCGVWLDKAREIQRRYALDRYPAT
jgi:hypothetical protein